MRLFFALPLPPDVRAQLVAWQSVWSQTVNNVKWVEEVNLHLTLKFLGEVSPRQLPSVAAAAREASGKHSRFTLHVGSAGVFPHPQRARILWAGLKDRDGYLTRLQQHLEQLLADLGFPGDTKPFTPHLTLGRLRQPKAVTLPAFPAINKVVPINNVVLYESILTSSGPRYQILATFDLL